MKACEYLVTVKQGATVLKQSKLSEQDAFNLLQKTVDALHGDGTITRLSVVAKLKSGKAQALEYNGRTMVFQVA